MRIRPDSIFAYVLSAPFSGIWPIIASGKIPGQIKTINGEVVIVNNNILKHLWEDIRENSMDEKTRELRRREQEYRSLAESLPDNIIRYDREGRAVYVNPVLEKTLGIAASERIGKTVREFHPDGSYEAYARAVDEALAGNCSEFEFRTPEPFLEQHTYQMSMIAERDERGEVSGVLVISRDITDRKRAEAALAASERQFRSLAENSPDNVILYDRECRAKYYNPRMVQTLGVAPEKILGLTPIQLGAGGPVGDSEYEGHIRRALETGESSDMELTLPHPDGGTSIHLIRFAAERDAEGKITGVLAIGRDVTDLKKAETERRENTEKLERMLMQTIEAIAATVEARDPYTAGHERRVAELAGFIAREMGLTEEVILGITLAAGIHDLGKIRVPAEILSKPGRLSQIEFELIKGHSQTGYDIIKDIQFPTPVAQMVLQHHERLDGSGYPHGLMGEQILLESRILAVADVVEAMSSHRPYRAGLGLEVALEEIVLHRGTLYDPAVVDCCLAVFRDKKFEFDS